MFPFSEIGPFDRSEKKALLVAFLFCAVFVVLISVSAPAKRVRKERLTIVSTTPATDPFSSVPSYIDPLQRFRVAPESFWDFDFMNFSYGDYVRSDGKRRPLIIQQGMMADDPGWFEVKEVFYNDLTGDGTPDAIVRLAHVQCDDMCYATDLFYIYTPRNGKLKNLWRYETGSYVYGCGLKSLTVGDKQMVMELFGRCSTQAMISPGPAKFLVEDATLTVFEFDGSRFITKSAKYIIEPMHDVESWEPKIRIY
jgi:hypothetical protein